MHKYFQLITKSSTPLSKKGNIVSGVQSFLSKPIVRQPSQDEMNAKKEAEMRKKQEKIEENQKRREEILRMQREERKR